MGLPFGIDASLSGAMDFVFSNVMWFVFAGVLIYIIQRWVRVRSSKKAKTVNIAEVERGKFVERMKHNRPDSYKWLYRGNKLIGKIYAIRDIIIAKTGKGKHQTPDYPVTQFVIKPMISKKLNIPRPLSKLIPFQIDYNMITATSKDTLTIPAWLSLEQFMGIYYGNSLPERVHTKLIIDHNLFRSSGQQIASTFFSKSQEQSTFDPEHAHALALKEKELQIEMAKKKGGVTSI